MGVRFASRMTISPAWEEQEWTAPLIETDSSWPLQVWSKLTCQVRQPGARTGLEEMPHTDCPHPRPGPGTLVLALGFLALGPHVHHMFREQGSSPAPGKTVEVKAEVAGMQNRL